MALSDRHSHCDMPPVLAGFEHVNRYWDKQRDMPAAKILPGEFYVTCHDEIITTVLGSCVAACVRDPLRGIGGMNHFMLPRSRSGPEGQWGELLNAESRYGNWAMEYLINRVLRAGGTRDQLEVKVFGGGNVIQNSHAVGTLNAEFVIDYLAQENMTVAAQDLGGIYPRKVVYFPAQGLVKMRRLRTLANDTILRREQQYGQRINAQGAQEGSVELFD